MDHVSAEYLSVNFFYQNDELTLDDDELLGRLFTVIDKNLLTKFCT